MNTLGGVLRPASNGDVAVDIPGGPKVDYTRLDDEVERVAGRLAAAGASPGTTVSIILPNGLEFIVAFLAVAPLRRSSRSSQLRLHRGRVQVLHGGRLLRARHSSGGRSPWTRSGGATGCPVRRRFTRRRAPGVDEERQGPVRIGRPCPAFARRPRPVPAHLRHDEQAEGCAAHARKPHVVAGQHQQHVRAHPR